MRLVVGVVGGAGAVDDEATGFDDALEFAEFFFQIPAQCVGGDEHTGEVIRQRDGVERAVKRENVVQPGVHGFLADELPQPRYRLDGEDVARGLRSFQRDAPGSRAAVDDDLVVQRRDRRDFVEVPGVEILVVVDLGAFLVDEEIGDGPGDQVFVLRQLFGVCLGREFRLNALDKVCNGGASLEQIAFERRMRPQDGGKLAVGNPAGKVADLEGF